MKTTETITENEIIAQFMGFELMVFSPDNIKCYNPKHNDGTISPVQFHTSWDWLIPVVEKIESLGYDTTMKPNELIIWDKDESPLIDCEFGETKLESAYKAVISFIHWYNQQEKL